MRRMIRWYNDNDKNNRPICAHEGIKQLVWSFSYLQQRALERWLLWPLRNTDKPPHSQSKRQKQSDQPYSKLTSAWFCQWGCGRWVWAGSDVREVAIEPHTHSSQHSEFNKAFDADCNGFFRRSPSVIVHVSMFDSSTGGWRVHVDVVPGHVHSLMPTKALLSGVRQCHDPWLPFVSRTRVWHWDGSVSHLHARWQTDQAWRCGPIEGCNNTALDWKCGNILAPALMGTQKDFGRVIRMTHIFALV